MIARSKRSSALRLVRRASLIATGFLAAACGGGGGGGTASCIATHSRGCLDGTAYAAAARTLAEQHAAGSGYGNQWGLATINANHAYAHQELATGAAPGAGVTVGLLDSEIYTDHPVFAGKTVSQRRLYADGLYPTSVSFSHGTAVASILGGTRPTGGTGFQGVAWGADLRMFSIPVGSGGGGDYDPTTLLELASVDSSHSETFRLALSENVDILNVSLGISGIIENYSESGLRANYADTISAAAQAGVARKTIVVISAGNAHGDTCTAGDDNCSGGTIDASSPEIWPGLVARIPELQGHVISVAAIDQSGGIASYSNRCGIAARWCLAAPGSNVAIAFAGSDGTRGWTTGSGTSYAAPMVSGGLAIMQQLFRNQLSPEQLVARLYRTANKSGRYANSAVYGQGLMDLGAATAPVGHVVVLSGNRIGGRGVSLPGTRWKTGPAFGDGVRRALGGQEIAGFDRLGAPFWFGLNGLVHPTAQTSLTARVHNLLAADRTPLAAVPAPVLTGHAVEFAGGALQPQRWDGRSAAPGSHLALAGPAAALTWSGDGVAVSAFTTEGLADVNRRSGAVLSWKPGNARAGLHTGVLAERDTVLGSAARGAFGGFSADTAFVGAETGFAAASWRLGGRFELGVTNARPGSGLVAGVSQLATSTMTLHAERQFRRGRVLRFTLDQPLRVERGRAAFSMPAGRLPDGTVLREHWTGSLAPSGRQIDATATVHLPLGSGTSLRFGAVWSRHPGHDANAAPDLAVLAGFRHDF